MLLVRPILRLTVAVVLVFVSLASIQTSAVAGGNEDEFIDVNIMLTVVPPMLRENKKGQIVGPWVDKINAFMLPRGLRPIFIVQPWRRTLRALEHDKYTLALHVDRVPEREDKYLWILPLSKKTYSIIANNDAEHASITRDEWMRHQGKTACMGGSYQCKLLVQLGYPAEDIQEITEKSYGTLAEMLRYGRMDFLLEDYTWSNMPYQNEDEPELVPLFDLATVTTYMVGGLKMDPEVRRRLMKDNTE